MSNSIPWLPKLAPENTRFEILKVFATEPFNNIKRSWTSVFKKANIEQFRWNDLRHHFASKLVMVGIDLNTVRELLGHSDIKMTLRYAHLAPEHKINAVKKIDWLPLET